MLNTKLIRCRRTEASYRSVTSDFADDRPSHCRTMSRVAHLFSSDGATAVFGSFVFHAPALAS